MNIKVNKQDLVNALDKVSGSVDSRPNVPVLSGILIESNPDSISFTGTNLKMTIKSVINIQGFELSSAIVPAKKFISIIKSLSGSEVSIKVAGNNATIKSGRSRFKINCFDVNEWPSITGESESLNFTINSSVLKDLFKSVMGAVSNDESRAALNGVLFDIKNNNLKCVATDGRRIAINESPINSDIETNCIVPTKALAEFMKSISGDVDVKIHESSIVFESSCSLIESKLIEGSYPNYNQIIPKSHPESIDLDRKSVLDSIKRVSVILNDSSESIQLDFKSGKDLAISANSGSNSSTESIPCESNDILLSFNPAFIVDALNSTNSSEITLKYADDKAPCILTDNDNFMYIVMPMRG